MSRDDGLAEPPSPRPRRAPSPHGAASRRLAALARRAQRQLRAASRSRAGVAIGPVFGAAEPPAVVNRHKIHAGRHRGGDRAAGAGDRAIAQAAPEAARPARRAAGGQPGRDRAAARRLSADDRAVAAGARRAAAHRRDAGLGRNRGGRRDRGASRRHSWRCPADDDPRRAAAPRRRGARDRPAAGAQPHPRRRSAASPACRRARCWSARACARPTRRCSTPRRLAGVATEEGGSDGHTAIMLRALGVPAVLGVVGLTQAAKPGDIVVLDGSAGTVIVQSVARRRWRPPAARSPRSPASARSSRGCAGCRR